MQNALPRSRPSRRVDYFRERDVRFGATQSDSHSSDAVEEYSLAQLMKDMSRLTVVHRLSGSQKLAGRTQARVSLSQKHLRLYRSQWQKQWVEEAPVFADNRLLSNVSETLRAKVFNWMMEIFLALRLSKHAYFRALALFDCFARSGGPVPDGEVDLWGLAALFLAVKYEEEEPRLGLADLSCLSHGKYPPETFAAAEESLFGRLGHGVGFPTLLEILDELMLRGDFVFESSAKLRTVAESVLIRCLLHPHMLRTRPDLFCGAALIYTIRLFYEHYRALLSTEGKPHNKHELRFKEEFFVDSIAKITRLNKTMLLSVSEEVQELVGDFEDLRDRLGLHHIARLLDLDALH